MIPDKIYIREYPDGVNQFWDRKKRDDVFATIHHEYIRKDALLEWANARKSRLSSGESFVAGERKMLKEIIDKLNSM